MANTKQGGQNKQGNIVVQDNANAKNRFGFGGVGPITLAPKTGDMFYLEFHDTQGTDKKLPFNRFAKGVSGVSVATTTVPVDRYGKRVYIPTRVDYPEVQLSMYDVVDGQMFNFAQGLYQQFFKNGRMKTDSANIEQEINANPDTVQGRQFSNKGKSFHASLEKVVIFHFFGNLDGSNTDTSDPRGESQFSQNDRTVPRSGAIQKIELINPIVTNITFGPSDYSDGQVRTVEFSLQPENIVFGSVSDEVTFPTWLMDGLPLDVETAISDIQGGDYSTYKTDFLNDKLNELIRPNVFDGNETFVQNTNANYQNAINSRQKFNAQNNLINQQKLDELSKLNNKLAISATTSPDADGSADLIRQEIQEAISRHNFVEAVPTESRFRDPFVPEVKYPQVADFAVTGNTYDGGTGTYGGSQFGSAIKNELVNAFFNGRSINWGNIRDSAAQGILGNTNIGTLRSLDGRTSTSRFGVAGDIIRDGINKSRTVSGGQVQTTTVPSNLNANSTSTVLNNAQTSIANLKNLTNGIR